MPAIEYPNLSPAAAKSNWRRFLQFMPVAVVTLVLATAISPQGFWIDEAATGTIVCQPTLAGWWRAILNDQGSTQMMPLYLVYGWVWEKIFGHGEWWLRLSNLPWLVLGLLAIPRKQILFLGIVVVSPFAWYYLNEFRPYAMQFGAGFVLLGSLCRLTEITEQQKNTGPEKFWAMAFCFGLVMLSGSSLLGMIWGGAGVAVIIVTLGSTESLRLLRQNMPTFIVTGSLSAALAVYYLWSLKHSNGATPGVTGIGSTLFIFYELFGFAGLGPSRAQLHTGDLSTLEPFIPELALYTMVLACLLLAGTKHIIQIAPRCVWSGVVWVLGMAVLLLLGLGVVKHFRVLGRHFAPLLPVLICWMACGIRELWSRGKWARLLVVLFILLNLLSSVSLRFAGRHIKDDYREAAAVAVAAHARGERVWWCADGWTGRYYGLSLSPMHESAAPGQIWLAVDALESMLTNQPPADLIVLSKPEIHDKDGLLQAYMAGHRYKLVQTFPVFTLWRRE